MIQRLLAAASAAALFVLSQSPLHADVILLEDGTVHPEEVRDLLKDWTGGRPPQDVLAQSADYRISTLSAKEVKAKRDTFNAAQIKGIWTTKADQNAAYQDAELQASAGAFSQAATDYGRAAAELKGAPAQESLYKAMLALWAEGKNTQGILGAADALLKAFPDSYWSGKARYYRFRVLLASGKAAEAKAELEKVANDAGMNARDRYEARIEMLRHFEYRPAGNNVAKLKAARQKFERLARTIASDSDGRYAKTQQMKARVLAAQCLVFEQDYKQAQRILEEVVADQSLSDKELLASAYNGLGDTLYALGKKTQAEAKGDEGKKKEAMEALQEASLHYLRVALNYGTEYAPTETLNANRNLARIYANLYTLGGEEDEKMGRRAWTFYGRTYRMLPRSDRQGRKELGNEAKAFREQVDAKYPPEG